MRHRETKPFAKSHTGLVVEPGYLYYVLISSIMSLLCSDYYSVYKDIIISFMVPSSYLLKSNVANLILMVQSLNLGHLKPYS